MILISFASTLILRSMATSWLPSHKVALPSSLLIILLSVEPCAAFRQTFTVESWINSRAVSPSISALHGVNGFSSGMDKSDKSKSIMDEDEQMFPPMLSNFRRRQVDRTTAFFDTYTSPTSTSNPTSAQGEAQEEEELCYLDDMLGSDAGETCFVSDSSSLSSDPDTAMSLASLPFNTRIPPIATELALKYLPFIMPVFAYSTYESTAKTFEKTVQYISDNNWVAVDGGQYQATLITPAINGLVVPSMALLFATLTSNTITTLRQRQLQIRTSLNTEANDLRMLSTMVDSLPSDLRDIKNHLREYLIQYSSRVIAESRPGLSTDVQMFIGSMDTELSGFLATWNKLSMSSYGTMYVDTLLPASNYSVSQSHFQHYENQLGISPDQRQRVTPFLAPSISSESYAALNRLRQERSVRLSALQSTFPLLHYVILALLGASICTVFLMETNQELLIFLQAIQLRILWSMLIGTFSSLAVVCYDLDDAFRGSYNVVVSVDQFYTIRETVRATIQMDQENVKND